MYQVQTPVHDDGGVEDECVFIQAVHFTASLARARQFNLTIIRSGRQIGFTGPGRVFDFYYKQASLGDYYCKRLAVVAACFGHTCVNTSKPAPCQSRYSHSPGMWIQERFSMGRSNSQVCVCVMAVSIKMTGRSGERVNAPLTSVCVSMASFFPSSHHYINNWGKKRIEDSASVTPQQAECDEVTYSRERVWAKPGYGGEIRSHTSSAN